MKSLTCYFHMMTNILAGVQICTGLPLSFQVSEAVVLRCPVKKVFLR